MPVHVRCPLFLLSAGERGGRGARRRLPRARCGGGLPRGGGALPEPARALLSASRPLRAGLHSQPACDVRVTLSLSPCADPASAGGTPRCRASLPRRRRSAETLPNALGGAPYSQSSESLPARSDNSYAPAALVCLQSAVRIIVLYCVCFESVRRLLDPRRSFSGRRRTIPSGCAWRRRSVVLARRWRPSPRPACPAGGWWRKRTRCGTSLRGQGRRRLRGSLATTRLGRKEFRTGRRTGGGRRRRL